jgi:tRNA-splicing ligase RtcB
MDSNHVEQPVPGGVPVKMRIRGVPLEDEAKRQLMNAARLPIVFKHIAAMPDVHFGIGATVGSVIATQRAVIPAAWARAAAPCAGKAMPGRSSRARTAPAE